jgi:hypothetical protein
MFPPEIAQPVKLLRDGQAGFSLGPQSTRIFCSRWAFLTDCATSISMSHTHIQNVDVLNCLIQPSQFVPRMSEGPLQAQYILESLNAVYSMQKA